MKRMVTVLLVFVLAYRSHSQDSTFMLCYRVRSTDLIIGMNWQGDGREVAKNEKTYRYVEIGIGKGSYNMCICGGGASGVYVSEEMYFGKDKDIFGTKVGGWVHYLIDFGLSLIYYTDFKRGNFKVRPELGVGLGRMRAVFGYNIPTINNKAFTELTHHNMQISIQFTVGVKQKKTELE